MSEHAAGLRSAEIIGVCETESRTLCDDDARTAGEVSDDHPAPCLRVDRCVHRSVGRVVGVIIFHVPASGKRKLYRGNRILVEVAVTKALYWATLASAAHDQ